MSFQESLAENPFAEGENRLLQPPPTAVVIFGASGDLTHRKLVPALANLAEDRYLPEQFVVIGAARSPLSDQDFRDKLSGSIKSFSRRAISPDVWEAFSANTFYQPLDGTKLEGFSALKKRLEELDARFGGRLNLLCYLSTSPDFFGAIASNLRASGISEGRTVRLVVEKPFGHDVPSARELNQTLRKHFNENQLFRIDHYLGKETVQNILVFRFANGIFEPLWNSRFIDHIQISVCEDIGVEGRAPYFDVHGITRDIVQNHVLQILSLLCIEPPISLADADSIRDEKVKVLRSLRRFAPQDISNLVARAQYRDGYVAGQSVNGYRGEKGVNPLSQTETAVAMRFEIDNWRWSGVPIYVRAGKRLPKRITEISVWFKRPPELLFKGRQISALDPNVLTIQVQPKEGISLSVNSKPPGPRLRARRVEMDFSYHHSFGVASPEAYERLLLDAMRGDATLFTRDDEIEEAWAVLEPVFASWRSSTPPQLHEYQAGSWGPESFNELLRRDGREWKSL